MLVNTDPLATLLAVADLLSLCGTVEIRHSRVFLNGQEALFLNASRALVLSPVWDGIDMALPARNVPRGRSAVDIAADVLGRVGERAA